MRSISAIIGSFLMMTILAAAATERPSSYETLLALARAGKDVDFVALREAYRSSPQFDPYSSKVATAYGAMTQAFSQNDCPTTLKHAQAILEMDFLFLPAHLHAAHCHDQLGNKTEAAEEVRIGTKLMDAITQGGNGRTPDTAFVAVSVAEQYALLSLLRVRHIDKRLETHGKSAYDVHRVARLSADGPQEPVSVYFRIDGFLEKLNASHGGAPLEAPSQDRK